MAKKKTVWKNGDIFQIELKDGSNVFGQVLDLQMKNVVRCAFFNEKSDSDYVQDKNCQLENLISLIATTREQLDYGVWKIVGYKEVDIPIENFPNESFRVNRWIGAKHYDASIVEEFLDAFYALVPWDDWADPNYLDKLLVDPSKKPRNVILKK
jgi:hypothetical protein